MAYKGSEKDKAYRRAYKQTAKAKASSKAYMDVYNKATWADPVKKAARQAAKQTEEYKQAERERTARPDVNARFKLAKRKRDGYASQTILYIMTIEELPGIYKVGRCKDIQNRVGQLQKCNFFKVSVVGEYADCGHLELWVHDRLAPYRVRQGRGHEWFKTTVEHIHNTIQSVINSNSASSSSTPAGVPSTNLNHPEESDEEDA